MIKITFFCILYLSVLFAQTNEDVINFNTIKKVINNDLLEETVIKKTEKNIKDAQKNNEMEKARFSIPREDELWTFITELWFVKSAPVLNWDFKKPDYGLDLYFRDFLERFGYFEKKFKILLVNNPNISHFGLPGNDGEYLFLLSVPFIKILDLSKLEISLLLFEDFLRSDMGYFKKQVESNSVKKLLGQNFQGKKIRIKGFMKMIEKYDQIVFKKGFSFQQQYEVTTKMSSILKKDLNFWNSYHMLIKKIDQLSKSNVLYKYYNEIYPSTELQLNWLNPVKRK